MTSRNTHTQAVQGCNAGFRTRGAARCAAVCLVVAGVAACSPAPPGVDIHDPYEDRNRAVHAFNLTLDSAIVRDAGSASDDLPDEYTQPVINFADNVGLPGAVLNGLMQGNIETAATNTMRFMINTTIGVVGLFDPAGVIGLNEVETDFGETLYVWGLPEGAYVELPLYGPSTERDAAGRIVDAIIDPLGRVGTPAQIRLGTYARIAGQVVERGDIGDTINSILYDSADGYAQARLIYLQNRRFELGDTESAAGDTFIDPFAE